MLPLQTVKSNQVVVFMKGIPAQPKCGFSNMVVKILEMEGAPYCPTAWFWFLIFFPGLPGAPL